MGALSLGGAQPLMMAGGGGQGMSAQHGYAGGAYPTGNGYAMNAATSAAAGNPMHPHAQASMYQYYPQHAMQAAPFQYIQPMQQAAGYLPTRQIQIKCRLYVPNSVVGALIGTKVSGGLLD